MGLGRGLAAAFLVSLVVLLPACGGKEKPAKRGTPPPPAAPAPPSPVPLPPPERPFSWQAAGAFVWHETDIDPEALGRTLRANGFGWVAVLLHDGVVEDPLEPTWLERFRRASGLPVGGWGVLRERPEREAELAAALARRHGLDFYVADAEAEYGYSGPQGRSGERYSRSQRFVRAFRRSLPSLPAGLSSYCRPDHHDLDWRAWNEAGFVFLPQAYVNDFGRDAAPDVCVQAAAAFFPRERVHPTIGVYEGQRRTLSAVAYAPLLARAGTVGFSVYLAETRMTDADWQALGRAIARRALAR